MSEEVDIVRCKDCNHSKWAYVCKGYSFYICLKHNDAAKLNHYCGYGERRMENEVGRC